MKKINYFLFAASLILFSGLVILVQAQNNDTDTTAPAAISDLAVTTTTVSSITLTWTAPGDDNMTGTSTSYDLRYATTTITESNWAWAIEVINESTPQVASSTETMTVSDLAESTTYYFAIKAKDEAENESGLSNVASGTTLTSKPEPTPPTGLTFEMTFTPRSLNLVSQGQWVTVHLFLPSSYRANQVDTSSVKLNDSLSPDLKFKGVNQFKKGKEDKGRSASNLVLKFSRAEFIDLVGEVSGEFEVTLTGEINGETFSASDRVNILSVTPEPEGSLVQATNTPEVYMIKNNRRRHIPSPEAFNRRDLSWQNIKVVSQEELDAYPEDELMKASDNPAVYLIYAGMKRHIPSPQVFESYGFDWNDISIVSPDELADYPEVNLIRAAGDVKVYLLAGGKKHWIPTIAIFNKHGYKWEKVIIVNSTEKDAIPQGVNVE